jgi:hypothetical protein
LTGASHAATPLLANIYRTGTDDTFNRCAAQLEHSPGSKLAERANWRSDHLSSRSPHHPPKSRQSEQAETERLELAHPARSLVLLTNTPHDAFGERAGCAQDRERIAQFTHGRNFMCGLALTRFTRRIAGAVALLRSNGIGGGCGGGAPSAARYRVTHSAHRRPAA